MGGGGGHVIQTLPRDSIPCPSRLTVKGEQFVYVCDYNRNCIVQLSRIRQVIRDVITAHDGLSVPLCVCCVDDKLYVGQEYGDIKIFTWSKAEQ